MVSDEEIIRKVVRINFPYSDELIKRDFESGDIKGMSFIYEDLELAIKKAREEGYKEGVKAENERIKTLILDKCFEDDIPDFLETIKLNRRLKKEGGREWWW